MRLTGSTLFSSISLSEKGSVPNKIQILKVGKFNHPSYGPFEITPVTLAEMKKNFDDNIRGIDMAFDYFHESGKEASGWTKALSLEENGNALFAEVDWTPTAEKKLSERELRYFSPDFAFKWKDPESGKTYKNVLFGGGLTNRPFLKEMQAIVAAEDDYQAQDEELIKELIAAGYSQEEIDAVCDDYDDQEEIELGGPGSGPQGGGGGSLKSAGNPRTKEGRDARRRELLKRSQAKSVAFSKRSNAIKQGLQNRASNVAQHEAIKKTQQYKKNAGKQLSEGGKMKTLEELQAEVLKLSEEKIDMEKQMADMVPAKSAEELKAEIAKLQAELEKLQGSNEAVMAEKKVLEEKIQCSEKEAKFTLLLTEGKACAAQKESFMKNDMETFIKLQAPVNLSNKGSGSGAGAGDDREQKVIKLAEEKFTANPKMGYSAAFKEANRELKNK